MVLIALLGARQTSVQLVDALTGTPLHKVQCEIPFKIKTETDAYGKLFLSDTLRNITDYIICESYLPEYFPNGVPDFIKLNPILVRYERIDVEGINKHSGQKLRHPVSMIEIKNVNTSQSEIGEIFSKLPGMMIKSYGGAGGIKTLSLYGSQGDRLQLQLNGVVLNNEQSGNADISQLPHALIQRLQFIPLGSSSRYGNSALAGVVNIASNEKPFKVSMNYRNKLNRDISVFNNLQRGNWSAGIGIGNSEELQSIPWTETGNYNPSQLEQGHYNWFTSGLKQNFLNLNVNSHLSNLNIHLNVLKVINQRKLSGKVYFVKSHPIVNDDLGVFSAQFNSQYFNFSLGSKSQFIHYQSDPTTSFPVDTQHKLNTTQIRMEKLLSNSSILAEGKYLSSFSNQTQPNDTAASQLSLGFTNRILSQLINIFSSYRLHLQKQQASIHSWEITFDKFLEFVPIRTSIVYSKNFKKPGFNDLFWKPFGNDQLKTEYSTNFYSKAEYTSGKIKSTITAFHIQYSNLIQWLPQTGGQDFWRPKNVDSANSWGMTFVLRGSSNFINNWLMSVTNNQTVNQRTEMQLPYTPKWIHSLTLDKMVHSWNFGTQIQSISSRLNSIPDYIGNPWILPGYTLVTLSMFKQISFNNIQLTTGVSINNAMDIRYQSVYGYPEPGRTIKFQLTVKQKD